MTSLKLRVEDSFDAIEHLRDDWDKIAEQLGGSIYSSFDWTRTWWVYYGLGKKLRIFLFYLKEELVSVLPLYIEEIGIRPLKISVARLVCSSIPPKAFNPPVAPALSQQIFEKVFQHLFVKDHCDVLSYGPVSERHSGIPVLYAIAEGNSNLIGEIETGATTVHTVFSVTETLDLYFDSLDKDERKKRKYEARLLRREHSVVEEVVSDYNRVILEFEEFARFHAEQWKHKGKAGHFGSWPRGLEFNRALVNQLAKLGRVRFIKILADGSPVSTQFVFSFGKSYFWELPARASDPKWLRYSLGPAGFFSVVNAATKEKITEIEGGLAQYEYKRKLNGKEIPARTFRLVSPRLRSRFLVKIFGALRLITLYGYQKMWYQRITPRLPRFFWKPQWETWLRLDF